MDGIIKGIARLKNKKDIIIPPSDKCGGVVLLDKNDYEEMARILGDANTKGEPPQWNPRTNSTY